MLFGISVLAACSGTGTSVLERGAGVPPLTGVRSTQAARIAPATATAIVLIDAGTSSPPSGWSADTGYTGGWDPRAATQTISTAGVNYSAPAAVYATQRVGMSAYTIGGLTPNTAYTVRLHFAEIFFSSAGSRVFGVSINGTPVLTNFDIFTAAGAANKAVVESSTATANSSGNIVIGFTPHVNLPLICGIEIDAAGSAPGPYLSPGPNGYPIYSSAFTGATPFHDTVASLMKAGATVRPATVAANYWAQGLEGAVPAAQTGGVGPLYVAASGDPAYTFRCTAYGTCNASGLTAHFPAGAAAQTGVDHHLSVFDQVYLNGEIDGWGGDGNASQACNIGSGSVTCSWGGFFPFSGSGLETDYSSADAGGYAIGLFTIAAQELLNGHISHALGIGQSCLDNNAVYPSRVGRNSDSLCPANLEPNARYGDLIHIKSSVNVASLHYSHYCQVIVQALQDYGAYTTDNNGSAGIALEIEAMSVYASATNPWFTTIFPSMAGGGDGTLWNGNFSYTSCLNRIPANDIEVIEISPNLP